MRTQPSVSRTSYLLLIPLAALSLLPLAAAAATAGGEPGKVHAWSMKERHLLRSLWIGSLPPPPGDPTNAFSANPKALRLGERLFFDRRFSKNGAVSCATCHLEDYSFTEEMPRAHGIGSTVRRTPHLIGTAYNSWFFWDGRADSLWAQALGPPENPNEHGISRTICAQLIAEHYRKEYEELFGPLPVLPRDLCNPIARPDPEDSEAYRAWLSLPPGKGEEINRVYVNMGKAIAAYVRMILPGKAKFDGYVEALLKGETKSMGRIFTIREAEGLRLFIGKAGCVNCHNGPLFTNNGFSRTDVYQPDELPPDRGRADGIRKLLASEFNCLGRYSDAGVNGCPRLRGLDPEAEKYVGAFKVPSLRNVAERPPYMHAGQYWSLWEVLAFHGGKSPGSLLSKSEKEGLEAFLKTLSGQIVYPRHYPRSDAETGGGHH